MNINKYSIVMFAFNEENNITNSIYSILNNIDNDLLKLTIIANGCTDRTVEIAKDIKEKNGIDKLEIITIEMGDKCNAWNQYINYFKPDSEVYFFVDADVEFTDNAFPRMYSLLKNNSQANAIAGLPFSGRNKNKYRNIIINDNCIFGNCYGVTRKFLMLVKEKKFILPIGLCWIDSAITKAIKRDLLDIKEPKKNKVIYDLNCGYKFTSLNPFSLKDLNTYFNRISRYEMGKIQESYLEKIPFLKWPKNMLIINQKILREIQNNNIQLPFYLKRKIINKLKNIENYNI